MKKTILILVFAFSILFPLLTKAQYIAHFIERDQIKKDTLIDNTTGNKFIVDKKRIFIFAVDKSGKLLWKTDPTTDNKLEKYRVDRPTIVYFEFGMDNTGKNQVIHIAYNNSQFGYLDKKTGH